MKKNAKNMSLYVFIFLIIIILVFSFFNNSVQIPNEPYNQNDLLESLFVKDEVKKITLNKDSEFANAGVAHVTLKNDDVRIVEIINTDTFDTLVSNLLIERLAAGEADVFVYEPVLPARTSFIFSITTMILLLVGFLFVVFLFVNQMQGGSGGGNRVMSFGKSKAKVAIDDRKKVTFAQVAGLEEEKTEISEVVEFLKFPKKFVEIGARIPKGVLLVGPPGTGKTLFARAVAGEAGVPFFSISGSDFVEMFVGVGASRVRDLFDQAKKNSPCIIFIDEIDAVGRRRGAGLGGGHDEREQTLNQLLVEMDGFAANEGVIIIAATNRQDILDPALLRPGRFDRQISIGLPDVKGREEILYVHAKGKIFSEDVNFKTVAQTTPGFTGADLENLLNESALLAARVNKKSIDMDDISKAFIKVGVGTEKKSRVISEKDRRITAYHEAGHAILFEALSELDPVHIVSVIPTGFAGGYTMPLPADDRGHVTRTFLLQQITSLLGGRAAEELVIKDITTGASNDIERASVIARQMVTKFGMSSDLGPIQFGNESEEVFIGKDLAHARNYGEGIATTIDQEIKKIMTESHLQAVEIISGKMEVLHKTAEVLIKREKITGEEFRRIYSSEDVSDLLEIAAVIAEKEPEEKGNSTEKTEVQE